MRLVCRQSLFCVFFSPKRKTKNFWQRYMHWEYLEPWKSYNKFQFVCDSADITINPKKPITSTVNLMGTSSL